TYAVLFRAGRDIFADRGALLLPSDRFPTALANTGKTVAIRNSKENVIDEVAYPQATAGRSYERLSDLTWHTSTDARGGTPGSENSKKADPEPELPEPGDYSQPGDVIINEIMANPAGLTELPETEYVEILNASDSGFNLKNWTFVYDGNASPLPDSTLKPGAYAILFRAERDIFADEGALLLPFDKFPTALSNAGKTIAIRNSKETVIDEVTYPQATAGRSYERLPDSTWHTSTDARGGTPGSENSKKADTEPEPEQPKPGDVIINEIMANPAGLTELPETEYVEIFNASDSGFNLKNWTFVYDGNASPLPDSTLKSGAYAVLFRAERDIFADEGALLLPFDKFPTALANTGKTVAIRNSKENVIDEVEYPQATAGRSYERLPDSTWHTSTDARGGTPGSENSKKADLKPELPEPIDTIWTEPLEIIINEILANPYTGGNEYIELYNRSNKSLIISNLVIALRNVEGNFRTHYPLKSITDTIQPDGYIVLTESREGVSNFYPQSPFKSVYEVKMPILNNERGTIVLFRTKDDIVIDEVDYSSDWHHSAVKNQKGVSLERINPQVASNDKYNWTSAVMEAGYGTPGYRNSQNKPEAMTDKISISSPEYMYEFDYYEVKYKTDKQGYKCRIEVYSTSGMKIAEIANNQLLTMEGFLKWDGKSQNGSKLSSGVYVFYAEFFNAQTGDRKVFKRAFIVK
ncbi:MAG: lamin tail domain-containing protein, partial [Prevotellaceae bacterium]|nr:lamin tail domain-containing protein [Prevotellaceae bacterium]